MPATKQLGTRSSGRQNVDTKLLSIHVKKCRPPHNKENIKKLYFFGDKNFNNKSASITKYPAESIVLYLSLVK